MGSDPVTDLAGLWTATGVVLGFAVAAFSWRIDREAQIDDQNRVTWLAPADMLNLVGMLVAVGGVFLLPILNIGGAPLARFSLGLALILYVGHAVALGAHYELFHLRLRGESISHPETGELLHRRIPPFPTQERIAVCAALVAATAYVIAAVLQDVI